MKKIYFVLVLIGLVAMLCAEIGWSGNIWPNSESFNVSNEDITVYYQIWKDGVTSGPGQGEDISAKLYYKLSTEDVYVETDMPYFGEVGDNDEYSEVIPQDYFSDNDVIHFYCEGYDASDDTYSYGTDQSGAGPFTADEPGIYYIGSPTSQDVTVTFQVDMSVVGEILEVSVAGSFNDWTAGSNILTDPDMDDIYTGEILFPAGSSPNHNYKFVNGTQYEDEIENRVLIIDDSGSTQILDVVYFNNQDPSNYTTQDVTVTFQVDMNVIQTADHVYVAGDFNDWTVADIELLDIDLDGIYSVEHLIPAGTFIQQNYKYINGDVWELGFGDRTFDIDDTNSTQILDVVTFNNFIYDNLTVQDVNVTFNINMNALDPSWYSNGVFLRGNVLPITGNAYDTPLSEGDTGFFSTTLLFPAGSYKDVSYVYLREDSSTLWYEFPEEFWRIFTIDDSGTEQNLDMVSWGENTYTNDELQIMNYELNNYPNPFNPTTTISFQLNTENTENAELVIYNLRGQKIRHYSISNNQSSIIWDGTDINNKLVSSGIYFYQLKAGDDFSETKRMLLLK